MKIPNPKSQKPNPKGLGLVGVWDLGFGIWGFLLFPGNPERLAYEVCLVRARTRLELLDAALVDFRDVEVPVHVGAEVVHAPEAAGEITPHAPRVEEVAVEVVLQHLVRAAIGRPQVAVEDVNQVDVGGVVAELEL